MTYEKGTEPELLHFDLACVEIQEEPQFRSQHPVYPVQKPPCRYSCSAVYSASMGGRVRKIITAEAAEGAEGAEMIRVNDLPEQSLRSLRRIRYRNYDPEY